MEGPSAWIIRLVLQDNVSRFRHRATSDQLRIATLRVLRVGDDAVPFSGTLGEHVEVVAVKVHGMGCQECIVDHETHGGVGVEVVDIPVRVGVGEIACIG